jgi:chromosome segregation ATPase
MSGMSPGSVTTNLPDNIEDAIRAANDTMTAVNAETLRIKGENEKYIKQCEALQYKANAELEVGRSILRMVDDEIIVKKTSMLELDDEIAKRQEELAGVNITLKNAYDKLSTVDEELYQKNKDIEARYTSLGDKESALNVYANALSLKEDKINRYLAMIETMKTTVAR